MMMRKVHPEAAVNQLIRQEYPTWDRVKKLTQYQKRDRYSCSIVTTVLGIFATLYRIIAILAIVF